jgi:hypothetical protein
MAVSKSEEVHFFLAAKTAVLESIKKNRTAILTMVLSLGDN